MNKIKSLWNKVRQTAIFKAFVIWIVVVIVLVFMVDKLLMPAFAGAFAKTGEVPNLDDHLRISYEHGIRLCVDV